MIQIILLSVGILIQILFFIGYLVIRKQKKGKERQQVALNKIPKKKSKVKWYPSVGAKGILKSNTTITAINNIRSHVHFELSVVCVGVYGDSQVKIKVLVVSIFNPDNPQTEGIIRSEFNKYYGVGVEFTHGINDFIWLNAGSGTTIELSNKDLGRLVKEGAVEIGEFSVNLTDDYNYKDRLDIIIEN